MWRRYKQDCIIMKRMRKWSGHYWYRFSDVNKILIEKPLWIDSIGLKHINILKKTRTTKWDTRHKTKWGKKGKRSFNYSSDYYTRIKDKVRFRKELLYDYEYGYR